MPLSKLDLTKIDFRVRINLLNSMFLDSGAIPEIPDIFSKLVETALICIIEEIIKKFIFNIKNSKGLVIMFYIFVILLGTAGRLSWLGLI